MYTSQENDRSHRRILMAGLALSLAVHAAVLAFAQITIPGSPGGADALRIVELADPIERVAPLEVVSLRRSATPGGGTEQASVVRDIAVPRFASVPAVLSAAVPNPIALLEKIEEKEKPENPVASYAMITPFRADASENPSALRPIDDRPVAVLAALPHVGQSGVGVTIGGGHCPTPGGMHRIAFSRTGPTF
jgi:hypothetical protein